MRIASVRAAGRDTWGVVVEGGLVDGGAAYPSVRAWLASGDRAAVEALASRAPDLRDGTFTFRPVVPDAPKILCIGVNYAAHREEMGRAAMPYPTVFTRFSNVQVGHGEPLVRGRDTKEFDFEGELAVVIGKRCRHVPAASALEVVAGYTVFQDATARDWQRHTTQFTPGKNFMGTGGCGPWLVTPDALPDPSKLTLVTRVNGREMQRSTTDLLIFDVPKLIEYLSTFVELEPGDVIATGTPAGVGAKRTPPVFLQAGDVVEVEIDAIGTLRNPVVDE